MPLKQAPAGAISDILARILAVKALEVEQSKTAISLQQIRANAEQAQSSLPLRDFAGALHYAVTTGLPAVIAEIKQASPSQGLLRKNFDPKTIAQDYARAGATCLSVLTDKEFFQGDPMHLLWARNSCSLPILRKDFMVDAYQIYATRLLPADCILLILAALTDAHLKDLSQLAHELGLAVIAECHNATEIERALLLPHALIGINNRDLRSFAVRLETTLELSALVPKDRLLISESGIHCQQDIRRLKEAGVFHYLVGEAFMRAENPGQALQRLFANF